MFFINTKKYNKQFVSDKMLFWIIFIFSLYIAVTTLMEV